MLARLLAIFGIASSTRASDSVLRVGDCWTYNTRPGEEASFLVIRKIERLPKLGDVVHISLFGLRIKNPTAPRGYTDQAGHLPISESSLKASLKKKIKREIQEADWQEGYKMWIDAQGGAFTKSVSDCVDLMEEAINHGKKG
jgi:hypothetical protein